MEGAIGRQDLCSSDYFCRHPHRVNRMPKPQDNNARIHGCNYHVTWSINERDHAAFNNSQQSTGYKRSNAILDYNQFSTA